MMTIVNWSTPTNGSTSKAVDTSTFFPEIHYRAASNTLTTYI